MMPLPPAAHILVPWAGSVRATSAEKEVSCLPSSATDLVYKWVLFNRRSHGVFMRPTHLWHFPNHLHLLFLLCSCPLVRKSQFLFLRLFNSKDNRNCKTKRPLSGQIHFKNCEIQTGGISLISEGAIPVLEVKHIYTHLLS